MFFSKNLKYLRNKHKTTQVELAEILGVKANTISNYEKGISTPDYSVLESLVNTFNTDAHSILYIDIENAELTDQSSILNNWKNNQIITQIHKPAKYTEAILESQEIILYDIHAAANLKTLFTDKNQNILGKITLPNISRCDGAMYVTGDSMDPLVKSGDIICYKEIFDLNNIIYGEMYLVSIDIEGDEFLTLKYITRSENGAGWIQLESFNKRHSPKDYELKHVNAIALIKISIRMNAM